MNKCERCGEVNPAEIHTCTPNYVDRRQWKYDPMTGKKLWQGLTDEEMFDCLAQTDGEAKRLPLGFKWFAEAIEAKLKEKNERPA
jgi:hypothetical protein